MNVLGVTPKHTKFGKSLKDGGCCLITKEHNVFAILEERLSRNKYDGGYELALSQLSKEHPKELEGIELTVSSTCCESQVDHEFDFSSSNASVNHHISHAIFSYRTSPFRSSLVVIIDGGGNLLEPIKSDNWWEHNREQHSYYSYSDMGLELIGRDFSEAMAYGIGEFWRGVTYAAGFTSSTYAAKVMELSSMGDSLVCANPFYIENSKIKTDLRYSYTNPIAPIVNALLSNGVGENTILPYSKLGDKIRLSAWAQDSIEKIVIKKLIHLKKMTGHKNLCLGGGVFLNCKLVSAICKSKIFDNVHVSFAPSDKGQCIGNALYAAETIGLIDKNFRVTNPFIGSNKRISATCLRRHLDGRNTYLLKENIKYNAVAEMIMSGALIGVYEGYSEFGSRSLGNRSIIASPFINSNKDKLNKLKGRESYTPLAPAIASSLTGEYFVTNYSSPYMDRVLYAKSEKLNEVDFSSALHQDGSARAQTVDRGIEGSFLSSFIDYCEGGMLLNTSFNGSGHPIVELPEEAIDEFFDLKLDALLINGNLLWRKSALTDSVIAKSSDEDWLYFFRPSDLMDDDSFKSEILQCLNLFTFNNVDRRVGFSLYDNYINWLEEGRKVTTIRFVPDGISIPVKQILPLVRTKDFNQGSMDIETKKIKVVGFGIKRFDDLNVVDANRDGFNNTSQLKKMLRRIYPKMDNDSYVSVNFIEQVH